MKAPGESAAWPSPAPRCCPHSLAQGPFLHLQGISWAIPLCHTQTPLLLLRALYLPQAHLGDSESPPCPKVSWEQPSSPSASSLTCLQGLDISRATVLSTRPPARGLQLGPQICLLNDCQHDSEGCHQGLTLPCPVSTPSLESTFLITLESVPPFKGC